MYSVTMKHQSLVWKFFIQNSWSRRNKMTDILDCVSKSEIKWKILNLVSKSEIKWTNSRLEAPAY